MSLAWPSITFSPCAHAAMEDCTTPTLPTSINFASLNIPRDLQVGSAIPGTKVPISWPVSCKSTAITGGKQWTLFFQTPVVTVSAVPGLDNVYQQAESSLAGVGFRFRDASSTSVKLAPLNEYTAAAILGDAPAGQTSFSWQGSFELVKTAAQVATGTQLLQPQIGVSAQSWANQTHNKSYFRVAYTINSASVTTCTVTNKTQMVTLPTVPQSALRGSYATEGSTPFKISLQCQKGTRIYMTMTDANNPTNTYNLLFPKGGSLGLVSVKVEKLDGTRVAFGPDSSMAGTTNQWFVGDSPDGVLDIPLVASYQLNSSSSTAVFPAGPVQVAATFTLSYQ